MREAQVAMLLVVERFFLWFVLYSVAGWVYESILVSVEQRRWVNRGFLNGPLCPIYGTGAVLCIALLSGLRNPFALFLACAVGASVLEYATSWLMERMFHARWWDYSNYRFTIQGRVCLAGAIVFGLGGVFLNLVAQPFVARWTDMIPPLALTVLCAVLLAVLLLDLIVTVSGMLHIEDSMKALNDTVQEYIAKAGESWQSGRQTLSDRLRELSQSRQDVMLRLQKTVLKALNRQQRRMIRAFPHFSLKSKRYDSMLEAIRGLMRRGR